MIFLKRTCSIFKKKRTLKNGAYLIKCKQIYANNAENVDGITVFASKMNVENYVFKITKCKDICLFSDGSLRSFMRGECTDFSDGVAAYSIVDNAIKVKYALLDSRDARAALCLALAVTAEIFLNTESP